MDAHNELARRLLTLAGEIMEDVSVIAIIGADELTLKGRAYAVADAAAGVQMLAQAALIALDHS